MDPISVRKKQPESYRAAPIPKALKLIQGRKDDEYQQLKENQAIYKIEEFMNERMLVGMKIERDFPGFQGKLEWLIQSYDELISKLPGHKDKSASFYFVYHGAAHAPMLGVEWNQGATVPDGMETLMIHPQKFAVFAHKGPLTNQEDTFNMICDADFDLNNSGIHFEVHNREDLSKDLNERFEMSIYLPMFK